MTRKEAIGLLSGLMFKGKLKEALEMAIASLETDEAYQLEYERTTKNDLGVDYIPRVKVIDYLCKHCPDDGECFKDCDEIKYLRKMPSVTLQEPRKGHCKDCKWWKDKDGVYRRGVGAESKCPINRREVMEGRGYCFMFEPQESGDKE